MKPFRRITLALSNSPADLTLLRYARMIANLDEADVEVCAIHVLPVDETAEMRVAPRATHQDALQDLQSAAERHLQTRARVSCHVVTGARVDRLLQFAAESKSDVILLGHRRNGTGRGSLCRRLAMQAPCSLWMVPAGSPPTISALVAAIDFSRPSAQAVTMAAVVASQFKIGYCTGVYVASETGLPLDSAVKQTVQQEGEPALEEFLRPLELHGVQVRPRIIHSRSVPCGILRTAADEQADLIIMGARGLSSSSAVLLGSESEQMLTLSDRPVLLTRERGLRLEFLEALLDRDLQIQSG